MSEKSISMPLTLVKNRPCCRKCQTADHISAKWILNLVCPQ